jgi:hypothetical protein
MKNQLTVKIMERREAMLWVQTLARAQKGDEEARQTIAVENKFRAEDGRPTVEEELREIMAQTGQ